MKKVFITLAAAAFASSAFAGISYDAITGQTFSYFEANNSTLGQADDTTLANLNTVVSIDMDLYNSSTALTNDTLVLSIYSSDPVSGLPSTTLFTQTYTDTLATGETAVNFALTGGFTPTATNVWTSLTIAGGTGVAGILIPNSAPTVGTSSDVFAWFDFTNAGTNYPGWSLWNYGGTPVANEMIRYNTGAPAPEPVSMAFLGLGVVGLIARRRNRS